MHTSAKDEWIPDKLTLGSAISRELAWCVQRNRFGLRDGTEGKEDEKKNADK